MRPIWLLSALLPAVLAQDGGISRPLSSNDAAGYSCDASKCTLPNCNCASTSPPGGLHPSDVPQFIVFTADDAVQGYALDAIKSVIGQRVNPNGCPVKMTYFVTTQYTNYSLVTDWFVAGNEIAGHTMTHIGAPPSNEINGNLIALNAFAGLPINAIQGFRAPNLNFTVNTLTQLYNAEFLYDSTGVASLPVTDPNTDAYWPYTLDYGMANNCLSVKGLCKGQPKLPGFWQIPMYAFFDNYGVSGPHLYDPYDDPANGAGTPNDTVTLAYMQKTFNDHYNGNRQPIGLYTHPLKLAVNFTASNAKQSTVDMVNAFLDWAQQQPNVWIVSNAQLLDWVRHPVPVSQLDQVTSLKCLTPQVDPLAKICNGIPQNEAGLTIRCPFNDSPFNTCYGCPTSYPSPAVPDPPQDNSTGQALRYRISVNCTTPFWDPVQGKCLCTAPNCTYVDNSKPIGPNGANLTGGLLGNAFKASGGSPAQYTPFNGAAFHSAPLPKGAWPAMFLGCVGAMLGIAGITSRF